MAMLYYWKTALEILILWYVIYMALLFVKGTRTEQLLKGIVIIGLIFLVAQQLGLDAISWILTRLFPISIIALVIIFQPELRRGLAQLGRFGLRQESAEVLEEIAGAAGNLSRRKIGALIVVGREVGLKGYIESGTEIDAEVTNYLLTSIFMPQSPLHDGAVIIQRSRLAAAGCVLPLPQDEKVSKPMGMRHRAAIGMSEETDAICIVVSEETGAISLANGGKFSHGLDEEGVLKALKHLYHKPVKKPFRMPAAFLRTLKKDKA